MATTYLHPGADDLRSLQSLATREDNAEMIALEAGLRRVVLDPGKVPEEELSRHARFEDASPEAFLFRLRRDLYGDGPGPPRAA